MSERIETWLLTVMWACGCVLLVGEALDRDAARSLLWLIAVLALGLLLLRDRRARAGDE